MLTVHSRSDVVLSAAQAHQRRFEPKAGRDNRGQTARDAQQHALVAVAPPYGSKHGHTVPSGRSTR